jgi:hypothetical protein
MLGGIVGGIALTAVAALLAAAVGVWSSLDSPWDWTVGYAAGALILAGGMALLHRYREGLPPPWGQDRAQNEAVRVTDSAQVLKTPGSDSTSLPLVDFDLAGRSDYEVGVKGRVRALRFVDPVEAVVRRDELPRSVRWRFRPILIVKRFTSRAIVVDERAHGFRVRAEIYYEEEERG